MIGDSAEWARVSPSSADQPGDRPGDQPGERSSDRSGDRPANRAALGSADRADRELGERHGLAPDLVRVLRLVEPTRDRAAFADALYRAYQRRAPRSTPADAEADGELMRALSRANSGRGTWEPDWTLERLEDGESVAVRRGSVVYFAEPRRVRVDPRPVGEEAGAPAAGGGCRVFVPEERQRLHAGGYLALGDAELAPAAELRCLVRVYWHLRASAAVPWVRSLTAQLNRRRVPFRLKVTASVRRFDVADAGVLYLEPAAVEAAWPVVTEVYARIAPRMRATQPLLTCALAPGLGLAEGPADGSSFGRDRAWRIAAAVAELEPETSKARSPAHLHLGANSFGDADGVLAARCVAVAEAFVAAGLDPHRPELEPGSPDPWRALPALRARSPARPLPARSRAGSTRNAASSPRASAPKDGSGARRALLAEAIRIGDRLCAEAFWHAGRCNWMGRDAGPSGAGAEQPARVVALGADLYQGSAGTGLFLAELAAIGGDEEHRQTAVAALERSLDLMEAGIERRRATRGLAGDGAAAGAACDEAPAGSPVPGLLVGPLGVVAAAVRGARRIGDHRLAARAQALLGRILAEDRQAPRERLAPTSRLDLLGGVAGAVIGLIGLGRSLRDAACLERARELGDALLAGAERDGETWSWPNRSVSGIAVDRPPLAGLSHGASGIALALLELHCATGVRVFRDGARGALAYEQGLFDPRERNWIDLRLARSSDAEGVPRFAVAWCHGAPGIALARLRAAALDHELSARYREQAAVALERTRVEAADQAKELADSSLCHGFAGLVDVLLCGAEALAAPELEGAARAAMLAALASRRGAGWASGVLSGGANPSLFLGRAGVGVVLLRLAVPVERRPPSVLLGDVTSGATTRTGPSP